MHPTKSTLKETREMRRFLALFGVISV